LGKYYPAKSLIGWAFECNNQIGITGMVLVFIVRKYFMKKENKPNSDPAVSSGLFL